MQLIVSYKLEGSTLCMHLPFGEIILRVFFLLFTLNKREERKKTDPENKTDWIRAVHKEFK